MFKVFFCLATFVATGFMSPAFGWQEAQQDERDKVDEKIVVLGEGQVEPPQRGAIATKLDVRIQDTPASVSVVTSNLFKRQDGEVLGDALRNISGVNVQTGSGVYDFFLIRGFDSLSNGLVLTDGTIEPEVTFYNLYNVDRVEVLKGPGAFLYGGNPLSGTVNLMRKKPVFENFGKLGLSYGSFNQARATIDYGIANRDSGVAFRVNGLWREADGFRDDKDNETKAINPSISFKLSEQQTLNIDVEYADLNYRSDAGLPIYNGAVADVPRERSYQSPLDVSDQEITRFQLEWHYQISDQVSLTDRAYHTELDWLSVGTIFNGVFPSATSPAEVYRSLISLSDVQRFTGNQFEVQVDFETGFVTHQLLGGLEYIVQKDQFDLDVGFLPGIDLNNPVETAGDQFIPYPGQRQMGDTRAEVLAPYVIDHMTFGPKCHVFLGARYDTIDFKDDISQTDTSFDKTSPMFGFLWSATPKQSFYGNVGEAFAPPSTLVISQDRKPEESEQVEIGWKSQWLNGRINTTVALFDLEKRNIAIPDATGITKQTGTQDSQGFEFEFAANLSNRTHAYFSYAYTEAELLEFRELLYFVIDGQPQILINDYSGNTPAFVPENLINLWVGKDFENGLGIGGGARFVDQQYIAEDNGFQIDSALTFDAAVSYSAKNWRVSANLKNITDEEYETRGFGNSSVIPADPIAAYARFELSF